MRHPSLAVVVGALLAVACSSNTTTGTPPPPPPPGDAAGTNGDGTVPGDTVGGDINSPPPGDLAGGDLAGGDLAVMPGDSAVGDTFGGDTATGDGNMGDQAPSGDQFTNTPPTANAGNDATVLEGQLVVLAGSGTDPDPPDIGNLTFTWTEVTMTGVMITNPNMATAGFTAPMAPATLTFQLEVCDTLAVCDTDTVTFTVVGIAVQLDFYVDTVAGNDMTGMGTQLNPFATIGRALTDAATAVTMQSMAARIHIAEGLYSEDIVMADGVSLIGGYQSITWARDVAAYLTEVSSSATNPLGVFFQNGNGYATYRNELDGLRINSANTMGISIAVSIEEGTVAVRNCTVDVPMSIAGAVGIGVAAQNNTDLTVENTIIQGGVSPGFVVGLGVNDTGTNTVNLVADFVDIDLPNTMRSNQVGVLLNNGVVGDLNDSRIDIQPFVGMISPGGVNFVAGVDVDNGAALTMRRTLIMGGGGVELAYGARVRNGGTLTTFASSAVSGGSSGPPGFPVVAAGALVDGSRLTATGSQFRGGSVSRGGAMQPHYSYGIRVQGGGTLDMTRGSANAGLGDTGVGISFENANGGVVNGATVNTLVGGRSCRNARQCTGIEMLGYSGAAPPAGQILPTALGGYSCCDPLHFGVVIEDTDIIGGEAPTSYGIFTSAGAMTGPATLCVNGSHVDAGTCTTSNTGACVGVEHNNFARFMLHNSIVYGGVGDRGIGVRAVPNPGGGMAALGEVVISNNYIHGGNPNAAGLSPTQTRGLSLVSGRQMGSGLRLLNNIINSGSGASQFAAYEEGSDADPGRFMNNNLLHEPGGGSTASVLYWDCTMMAMMCTGVTTSVAVNMLVGGVYSGNIGDVLPDSANCMVDASPRGGDYNLNASGNMLLFPSGGGTNPCIDTGIERNASCNICQTPWVSRGGDHRVLDHYDASGGCGGFVITPNACLGDGIPDMGATEFCQSGMCQ